MRNAKMLFFEMIAILILPLTAEGSARRRAVSPSDSECPPGYILRQNLIQENDGDKHAVGEVGAVCTGELLIGPKPHEYYKDPRGVQYLDITTGHFYLGDCDDSATPGSIQVWRSIEGVEDPNMDGVADSPIGTACVGVQSLVGERWYFFREFKGSTWLGTNPEQSDPANYDIAYGALRGGTDVDLDGYAAEPGPGIVVGMFQIVINGRTYRRSLGGEFSVLVHADIIGYGDRDDRDSLIH